MCFIVERLRAALFSPVPNAVGFADKTMVYAPSHTQSRYIYHSLAKERPRAEHLTSPPKRGVGALSSASTFNYERTPKSCLQRLDALEANNWTNNNRQRSHQRL